jgi:hypothetical protein
MIKKITILIILLILGFTVYVFSSKLCDRGWYIKSWCDEEYAVPTYKKIEFAVYDKAPFLSMDENTLIQTVHEDMEKKEEYYVSFLVYKRGGEFNVEKTYDDQEGDHISARNIASDIEAMLNNQKDADKIVFIHNHVTQSEYDFSPPTVYDVRDAIGYTHIAREKDISFESWILTSEGVYILSSKETNAYLEEFIYNYYLTDLILIASDEALQETYKAVISEKQPYPMRSSMDITEYTEAKAEVDTERGEMYKRAETVMNDFENNLEGAKEFFSDELVEKKLRLMEYEAEYNEVFKDLFDSYKDILNKNISENTEEALQNILQSAEPLRIDMKFYTYEELLGEE